MVGFAEAVKAYRAKTTTGLDETVRQTVIEFGDRLVTDWTPLGDPLLWKAPPPADYRPGNLRSSWFYSEGRPTGATTEAVNDREVHNLDAMPQDAAGRKHYLSNSAPHAGAIEAGHSLQAPAGILVNAQEFSYLATSIARRVFK